jgi:hypothetical protein
MDEDLIAAINKHADREPAMTDAWDLALDLNRFFPDHSIAEIEEKIKEVCRGRGLRCISNL